ncbi:MAG: hypothetical protein WCY25_10295 [Moheibacter sp.]
MKNIFYKSLLLVSLSVFTFSCFGSDDDGTDQAYCNVDSYVDAYLTAVNTFNANPTSSNCVNLKNKGIALLNAIHNCDYFEDETYWEDAIGAYNNVNCNDL